MKKHLYSVLVLVLSFSLILPSVSYAWHHRYYRGCCGCCNGWGVGAAIAGGLLVGAVVGSAIAHSAVYSPPPRRVYYAPRPNTAYAYPDPAFVARYNQQKASGEWVAVPGQSVNGKWVPEHKVWIP